MESLDPELDVIRECVSQLAFPAALSLAEVRHATKADAASALELARVLLASGDADAALLLLATILPQEPQAAYLFARAAVQRDRLGEAEEALRGLLYPERAGAASVAPFAHHLLGDVLAQTNRMGAAQTEWRRALQLSPYLWPAYKSLAASGDAKPLNPAEFFKLRKGMRKELKLEAGTTPAPDKPLVRQLIMDTPEVPSPMLLQLNIDTPMETGVGGGRESDGVSDSPPLLAVPKAPRKQRKVLGGSSISRRSTRSSRVLADENNTAPSAAAAAAATRRSPRFSAANSENAEQRRARHAPTRSTGLRNNNSGSGRGGATTTTARLISPSPSEEPEKEPRDEEKDGGREEKEATAVVAVTQDRRVLEALGELGPLWRELGAQRWGAALEELDSLSPCLRRLPSVVEAEARCHFELAEYGAAVEVFRGLRRDFPWHTRGLELFSTALWHMQDQAQLSALAQSLVSSARRRPETWCVLGNAFSLHKDHEKAVRFLQRAIQLEQLPYAYTLLGHEYLALESVEKATQAFRTACRLDPRHYNAWFGLGEACKREEQLGLALVHFERALALNPANPILQCQVAEVVAAIRGPAAGLARLGDSDHPVARFHRAQLLFAGGDSAAALAELADLKRLTPRESRVFFLSGKIHSRLGHQHLSLMDYTWATELEVTTVLL